MKNKEEIINTTWRKLPYVWSVCICIVVIIYLRNKLIALLKSYPHEKLSNFVWQYIQNNNHQIATILLLIFIISAVSIFSIVKLIKGFKIEEEVGKVLNIILILLNISVIIITLLSNLIVFKVVMFMAFACVIIGGLFAGLGNSSNT